MQQDLALATLIGCTHVERNGHHYFAGLSMYPAELQERVIENHGDLYRMHDGGFAVLSPRDGQLSLRTVNRAPFGVAEIPDVLQFESWRL